MSKSLGLGEGVGDKDEEDEEEGIEGEDVVGGLLKEWTNLPLGGWYVVEEKTKGNDVDHDVA